jgi:hypothetical protein
MKKIGVVECWSNGVMGRSADPTSEVRNPLLQDSNTPSLQFAFGDEQNHG